MTDSNFDSMLMVIAKQQDISPCSPRKPSHLNRLHRYDGNVIGGLILGSGMALTGACPGTVLIQVSKGISSGIPALGGAVLGGILWSRFGYHAKSTDTSPDAKERSGGAEELTVYESAKIREFDAVLIYELICLATIVSVSYFAPGSAVSQGLNPVLGGLLIGGSQAASLLLTKSAIGVSTAYERVGQYFCHFTKLTSQNCSLPSLDSVVFALGMVGGSWGLSKALGLKMLEETVNISFARAFIGGVALVLGARIAGGCTSGHGISGMSTLSKSSFVTVGAMFAGGIGVSMLLGWLL